VIKTQITITGGPNHAIKHLPETLAEAMGEAIGSWHSDTLPKHFLRSAHARYGYKARSRKWIARKLKRTGQAIDLVGLTGELKRQTTRAIRISTTKTGKHAKGVISGPRYLYQYRKGPSRIDKAAELLEVTNDEAQKLAEQVDRDVTDRLNRLTDRQTIRTA